VLQYRGRRAAARGLRKRSQFSRTGGLTDEDRKDQDQAVEASQAPKKWEEMEMKDQYLLAFTLPGKNATVGYSPEGCKVKFIPEYRPPAWTIVQARLIEAQKKFVKADWTHCYLDLTGDLSEVAARYLKMGAWFDNGDFRERAITGNFARGLDIARRAWLKEGHEWSEVEFQWGGESRWGFRWERDGLKDNFKDIVQAWGEVEAQEWFR
jgi:hypothetical protein